MLANLAGSLVILGVVVAVAIAIGLIGLRWRAMRSFLVVIGPLYAVGIFVFFQFEGAGSDCAGAGLTFHCWEISYASTWGVYSWVIVAVVMILSLAPIASAWLRWRAPAVTAAVLLPLVIGAFLTGLIPWVPAWAGVLAAAIAGPPSTGSRATSRPTDRADTLGS
jgi:hypothetical protein